MHMSRHEEAVALVKQAVETVGSSPKDARQIMLGIYYLIKAVKLDPRFAEAWLLKGSYHRIIRETSEALKCANKALYLEPKLFDALVLKAIIMQDKQKYYKSAVLFNKALQVNPQNNQVKIFRDEVIRKLSEKQKKKLFRDTPAPVEMKKKRESKVGEMDNKIEEEMLKATGAYVVLQVSKPPFTGMDPNSQFNEGLKLLEQMELDKALKYFDSAIDTNPNNEMLWNNMGVAAMGLKFRNDALMAYWKALRINPNYYIGFYNVAALYYECRQYQEAIKYYDEALKLNPKCAEAFQDRKLAYEHMSEQEIAQLGPDGHQKLRDKVYSDPLNTQGLNLARALMNMGSALVDLGNGKDAILGSSKRILKNQNQLKELFEKGQELIGNGKTKQGIEQFDEALKLNPQDAIIWTGKGFALSLLKRIEEALECFEKATKLDPDHELAWLYKGATLGIQSKFEEAIACYEQVLRINPLNEDAKAAKAALKT